jgi:hypothetical protein
LKVKVKSWMFALVVIVALYSLVQYFTFILFGTLPNTRALPWDLLANVIVGCGLFALSRNLFGFSLLFLSFIAALNFSNAAKLKFFGTPIMPDDFVAVKNLFLLFKGWQLLALTGVVFFLLVLLIAVTRWKSFYTWGITALLFLVVGALQSRPGPVVQVLDDQFGNVIWNQRGNFQDRGLMIHLVQEWARQLQRRVKPPDRKEVEWALRTVGAQRPSGQPGPVTEKRNLHMIALESFWDPTLLGEEIVKQDPMDPRFRELWSIAGNSQILSPVWGGRTANAEFEALCGFPVSVDGVVFEGWLENSVPCLPDILSRAGYRTVVSHPNFPAFFNRINSYRRLGFDTYWSKDDFVLDDMHRNILFDASLYRQVTEKLLSLDGDGPVLNYILTFFGHYPYRLGDAHPPLNNLTAGPELISNYASTLYYKSRALMDYLEVLRAEDPDALIVIFGDHLPYLGQDFDIYTEAGLLASDLSKFSEAMFGAYVRAPVVIIDGSNGPLDIGDIPLYGLADVIRNLLSLNESGITSLAVRRDDLEIRPLPNMFLVEQGDLRYLCRGEGERPAVCDSVDPWMKAMEILFDDIFRGKQFTLEFIEP